MNNHIIKIQRYYRTHLIKRKLYILKQYKLKNKNEIIFDNFTKIIDIKKIIEFSENNKTKKIIFLSNLALKKKMDDEE